MANTLNYSINNKKVSFSTKSLTIDGSEYLYKDITAIKHSSAKCLYLFKVDGKWHELFYDEAHKKGVSTIFKKVADHLTAVKKSKAAAEKPAQESVQETKAEPEAEPAEEEAPSLIEALAETEGIPAEPEVESEPESAAEEAPAEEAAPEEESVEEEAPAKEEAPSEGEKPSEEEKAAEEEEESKAEEPDKKSKKKKAFIVFAIIIALFIIAGIIYFFTIGTF